MKSTRWMVGTLVAVCLSAGLAEATTFTPHELFAIPFGTKPDLLGASVDGGRFLFPQDFTMDTAGRFYIYDAPHHRIARYSPSGRFELDFRYLPTARQVFAHPDSHENLWLLITDPSQGLYYGVYDSRGKPLHSGIFSRFNNFRLHVDDDGALHILVSADQDPKAFQSYILDETQLLMKKDPIAHPPETHHEVRKSDHTFFIDQVPDASKDDSQHVNRVTDETHRDVAELRGTIIYVTDQGEIYTRVGEREIDVYDVHGSLNTKIHLRGLRSACAALRFDPSGNIYELDGIPDQSDAQAAARAPSGAAPVDAEDLHYSPAMYGMRMIQWRRQE